MYKENKDLGESRKECIIRRGLRRRKEEKKEKGEERMRGTQQET